MAKGIKRGDIFYCNFGAQNGSVQGGIRPALAIQGDASNSESPTTVVAALTTHISKKQKSHIRLGPECGLKKLSVVQLEQIRTINQTDLMDYIGSVTDRKTLRALSKAQINFYELYKPLL